MNNSDERDYAEEAANQRLMEEERESDYPFLSSQEYRDSINRPSWFDSQETDEEDEAYNVHDLSEMEYHAG